MLRISDFNFEKSIPYNESAKFIVCHCNDRGPCEALINEWLKHHRNILPIIFTNDITKCLVSSGVHENNIINDVSHHNRMKCIRVISEKVATKEVVVIIDSLATESTPSSLMKEFLQAISTFSSNIKVFIIGDVVPGPMKKHIGSHIIFNQLDSQLQTIYDKYMDNHVITLQDFMKDMKRLDRQNGFAIYSDWLIGYNPVETNKTVMKNENILGEDELYHIFKPDSEVWDKKRKKKASNGIENMFAVPCSSPEREVKYGKLDHSAMFGRPSTERVELGSEEMWTSANMLLGESTRLGGTIGEELAMLNKRSNIEFLRPQMDQVNWNEARPKPLPDSKEIEHLKMKKAIRELPKFGTLNGGFGGCVRRTGGDAFNPVREEIDIEKTKKYLEQHPDTKITDELKETLNKANVSTNVKKVTITITGSNLKKILNEYLNTDALERDGIEFTVSNV